MTITNLIDFTIGWAFGSVLVYVFAEDILHFIQKVERVFSKEEK